MTTVDYNKMSDYIDDDYIPSIVYDPEVSLNALRPRHINEIIRNPYYFKAAIRCLQVFGCFLKILLDYWYDKQKWTYFKQWIKTGSIEDAESVRRTERAVWLRNKLLELGPTFIKIGQAISTRADLLRREYITELAKLQDRVPAFAIETVEATIKEELGKSTTELFASFNIKPLAAASLGQVHRAELFSGEEVVVKIQRPDLVDIFNLDVAILKKVARFCRKFLPFAKNRNWPEIVDEFGKTLFEEIDYILEAKNAEIFRENFQSKSHIYIPKVFKEFTTRKVLTLEYKPGIKIDNIKALDAAGIDRESLSYNLLEAYLKQFLQDGIYHADPHPGNLAVEKNTETIIFYDFGMIGRIDNRTKVKMLSAFLNVVNRRADALLRDLVSLKMIDRNTADLDKIRNLIQWCFDNYYDVPYEDVKFEEITDELADIMYAFPFRLPASFTYIVRALVTLEGLCVKLNPRVNFMAVAVPYARKFFSHTDLFEMFTWDDVTEFSKMCVEKFFDLLGLEIPYKSKGIRYADAKLDKEDLELIRRQMVNGFGIIGLGIIFSFVFIITAVVVVLLKNIIFAVLLIVLMLLILPIYFAIMLAVLLSKPVRHKEMLRKHLEQRNKFDRY